LDASTTYGDKVDPIADLIDEAATKGELRGIRPDSDEAAAIKAKITKQIKTELAKLKRKSEQKETN